MPSRLPDHAPLSEEGLEELDEPELSEDEGATTSEPTAFGFAPSRRQQLRHTAAYADGGRGGVRPEGAQPAPTAGSGSH